MKQDTINRYQWIETQLYWGGGFTASELGECFGIARQNAQASVSAYRSAHPRNLYYDRATRRHLAEESFSPHYIPAGVHQFLEMVRGDGLVRKYRDEESWTGLPFYDADRPLRPDIREEPVRELLAGLRKKMAVSILYCAKSGTRQRTISPHHLVYADGRFHVRAFCHLFQRPMDIVLSRVIESSESSVEWVSDQCDKDWQRKVDLLFCINTALPSEVKEALRADHRVDSAGCHSISTVRVAVTEYVVRQMTTVDARYGMPLWELHQNPDD